MVWVSDNHTPGEGSVLSVGCREGGMPEARASSSFCWISPPALRVAGVFSSLGVTSNVMSTGRLFLTVLAK